MAKPTDLPVWATTLSNDGTTGQPNRAEPSSGKKVTGFTFNEKPPRQNFNWLFNVIGNWITWLNTVLDQDVSSTASPSFVTLSVNEVKRTAGQLLIRTISSGILAIQSAGELIIGAIGGISFANSFSVLNGDGDPVASISDTGNITGRAVITGTDFSVRGSVTNITGAELETLSAGGNADSVHTHGFLSAVCYAHLARAYYAVPSFAFADGNVPLSVIKVISNNVTDITNGVQITKAGKYRVFFKTRLTGTATINSACAVAVRKNGTTEINIDTQSVSTDEVNQLRIVEAIVDLAEGDTVTATISTGGSGTFSVVSNNAVLDINFIKE